MTYARVHFAAATDTLASELDDLIGRIVRKPAVLRIEHHPARVFLGPWVVRDLANDGEIMVVRDSREQCERWAAAFVAREDGARLEGAEATAQASERADTTSAAAPSSSESVEGAGVAVDGAEARSDQPRPSRKLRVVV